MKVERPPELKRTAQISLAVTPDQKRRIIEAAHGSGRVVAHFVRRAIMNEVERLEKAKAKAARGSK